MEQVSLIDDTGGTSAHIDECFEQYPHPIDVAKYLGRQWLKHPIQGTITICAAVGLVALGTLYVPIKLIARRSNNKFILKYIA
jgi:hypothetical protein